MVRTPFRAVFFAIFLVFSASVRAEEKLPDPEHDGRKLSEWTKILKTDSIVRKRKAAASAVGAIALKNSSDKFVYRAAIESLGGALREDGTPAVRLQVANELARQPFNKLVSAFVVNELRQGLRGEKDKAILAVIVLALGTYGENAQEDLPKIAELLKDSDVPLRAAAAEAIGRVGPPASKSADAILTAMKDPEVSVRRAAASALGRIDPENREAATKAIIALLDTEKDADFRKELLNELGLVGDASEKAVKAVAEFLGSKEERTRRDAVAILARYGPPSRQVETQLKELLTKDEDRLTRVASVRALVASYGVNAAELVPLFIERLKTDREYEVRLAIVEELGGLSQSAKSIIPLLREAQTDTHLKVREAATRSLKRLEKTDTPK